MAIYRRAEHAQSRRVQAGPERRVQGLAPSGRRTADRAVLYLGAQGGEPRADALSKRVPLEWKLSDSARADMATNFPNEEWTLPDLNHIGNVLLEARNSGKDLVLVHPVWPGAAWWNLVQAHGSKRVNLTTADQSLVSTRRAGRARLAGVCRPRCCAVDAAKEGALNTTGAESSHNNGNRFPLNLGHSGQARACRK